MVVETFLKRKWLWKTFSLFVCRVYNLGLHISDRCSCEYGPRQNKETGVFMTVEDGRKVAAHLVLPEASLPLCFKINSYFTYLKILPGNSSPVDLSPSRLLLLLLLLMMIPYKTLKAMRGEWGPGCKAISPNSTYGVRIICTILHVLRKRYRERESDREGNRETEIKRYRERQGEREAERERWKQRQTDGPRETEQNRKNERTKYGKTFSSVKFDRL